jgi:hypothetical protein
MLPGTELLADYSNGEDAFWDTITANTQQCNYIAADRQQLEVRAGLLESSQCTDRLPLLVCCSGIGIVLLLCTSDGSSCACMAWQ